MTHPYLRKLHLRLVKGEFKNPIKGQVRGPAQIFSAFKDIKDWAKETLIGVYMSDTAEMNTYAILSVGGESTAVIEPAEVFQHAIVTRSRYFILIHNHPSGKTNPSPADRDVMKTLKLQSQIMNCYLLDFIIVGENSYWSMFEEECGGEYTVGKSY